MPAKTKQTIERETPTQGIGAYIDPLSAAGFLMKWNTELTRFYAERYRQYWLVPWRMMSGRSLDDILKVQNDFRAEMLEAYRAEAANLSAIASEQRHTGDGFHDGYAEGLLKAQDDAVVIIDQAKKQAEHILSTAQETAAMLEGTTAETATRKQAS